MTQKALVKQLSKVLCLRACAENTGYCPHCGIPFDPPGICQNEMSDTFLGEAQAVLDYLVDQKIIKKAKLL